MLKVRRRLVNFRVTDEELEQLKTATALRGARCLSDFARSATLEIARVELLPSRGVQDGDSAFSIFDRRLARLESSIARLMNVVGGAKNHENNGQ